MRAGICVFSARVPRLDLGEEALADVRGFDEFFNKESAKKGKILGCSWRF